MDKALTDFITEYRDYITLFYRHCACCWSGEKLELAV